jgi:hypothetical protein
MQIHASFDEFDLRHPLYEDDQPVLLMDRLPQVGIGSVFIRTIEIGVDDPPIAFLMFSKWEIEELKDCEEVPSLQKAIEKIIEYATTHPKDQYLFLLTE